MKTILIFLSLTLIISCSSDKPAAEEKAAKQYDSEAVGEAVGIIENIPEISDEMIEQILKSLPSPLEMSILIKSSGAKYSRRILNSTGNKEKYVTDYQKALNLGIYGADLAYVNLYDKKQDAITILPIVHGLADDIKIGHFFDFKSIKRLAVNSQNLDSLLYITTSNFEKMNKYLLEQERMNLSVLMLTGGWLESTYILVQIVQKNKSEELEEHIVEQKVTLDNIIFLLSVYQRNPGIGNLYNDFKELKKLFDMVEINYTYKEPTYEERDGMLVVINNSTTEIIVPDGLLDKINKRINTIRNAVIS